MGGAPRGALLRSVLASLASRACAAPFSPPRASLFSRACVCALRSPLGPRLLLLAVLASPRRSPASSHAHTPTRTLPATSLSLLSAPPAAACADTAGAMDLHKCQFFNYVPSAVQAIAYHPSGDRVAVARADADIEIWSVRDDWLLVQVRRTALPRAFRGCRPPPPALSRPAVVSSRNPTPRGSGAGVAHSASRALPMSPWRRWCGPRPAASSPPASTRSSPNGTSQRSKPRCVSCPPPRFMLLGSRRSRF